MCKAAAHLIRQLLQICRPEACVCLSPLTQHMYAHCLHRKGRVEALHNNAWKAAKLALQRHSSMTFGRFNVYRLTNCIFG
jgi:hypothetical protein